MSKKLIIGIILFTFSLVLPVSFYILEGEHKIVTSSQYLSRNNNNNQTQLLEKFGQLRIIYQASKNIKLNRYDSFSTIDDNNVINSFPIYHYYSPALYYGMGLLNLITQNVVITWVLGIWFFSLLYVCGFYLLAKKISKDTATSLLVTFIAITAPYMTTNILSRYSFSEFVGGSVVPLILYLFIEVIEKGKKTFWKEKETLIDYLTTSIFFTALSTFFVLTHNITTLYMPIVCGIPLLVYLFTTVKPNVKSILFFLPSLVLVILGALFYIIPSIQTQQKLLIADTFAGLLFPYIKLNDLGSLFSITPYVSPMSTTPHLYLQIGVPILLLAVLFFRVKVIHIYIIFALIIFAIVSPVIWHILPQPLLAIQFPYRLLAFVPILFIFAAKKLSEFALIGGIIAAVIFGLMFMIRPGSAGSFHNYDFDMFPSVNAWNYYYKGENQNVKIETIASPESKLLETQPDPKNKFEYPLIVNPAREKTMAVTYRYIFENEVDRKLPAFIATSTDFNDGTNMKTSLMYGLTDSSSMVISNCLRNGERHETRLGLVKEFMGPVRIEQFTDTTQMYVPVGDQFIPVTCTYEQKENGRIFVFKMDKQKKTVLLPIFFSELNQVLDRSGNPVPAKPFIDARQRSYTAIENPDSNDEIRIKLYGVDPWREVSYPVLYFILTMTFVAIAAKIGLYLSTKFRV